ncbi:MULTISPECIES: helix-turn-helix transcriptional regulator [unclassified Micromonospora]|uniref:helix-turn-helix transcriptional regulator n=1 Tax=unclassified Micromonospora TaxID=2617518 RepID=UPI0024176FD8|nr:MULTISPECIES: helix-turn-helix transcriptional regulator [unclassified Micromonospora]MDG4819526.1 helix-turn-helix transcriptional regulator [Micromonospora sp. WMMD956]WFE55972.1 helix-turn-helix transcriptional regulator [Micromonospora sp. WMMD712]
MRTGDGAGAATTERASVIRDEVATRDPDLAHHTIAERYSAHRPRFTGSALGFRFRLAVTQAGELGVDEIVHSMDARSWTEPYVGFMAVHVRRGWYHWQVGRDELALPPGAVGRFHNSPMTVQWSDVTASVVRLSTVHVARVAAARTDVAVADFRFEGMAPVSAAMARAWAGLSAFLDAQAAAADGTLAHPLIRASLAEHVATTALAVFPNTTMTAGYVPGPSRVEPAVVRRAVAHIEAHAAEPITVAQIAQACGVGPRGLQAAFARHLGVSPTAHLRRVRLDRAHRDLVDADPAGGATVAAIARRWGWGNPGRFAEAYRRVYGRPPSHTLRA